RIERQKKVELLGRTRQDGKDDQREFEQPKRQQSPVIHREQDAASTLARNSLCFGSIGLATFTGAYRFPQRGTFRVGDVLNLQFILAARPRLELDLDHAEQPRDQRLL